MILSYSDLISIQYKILRLDVFFFQSSSSGFNVASAMKRASSVPQCDLSEEVSLKFYIWFP